MKISVVMPITHQRCSSALTSARLNPRIQRPGAACTAETLSRCTPISGANSTATSHDSSSATAITANMVNTYSPAELWFRPIGTKPATVTSVPVSMGKAVEV
ncbi:hypothetical protein PS689_05305 [Pseudomonas fluorescens]|nr:hypothetical protein PS689_05305 [Pseudomonas fluorescens]